MMRSDWIVFWGVWALFMLAVLVEVEPLTFANLGLGAVVGGVLGGAATAGWRKLTGRVPCPRRWSIDVRGRSAVERVRLFLVDRDALALARR